MDDAHPSELAGEKKNARSVGRAPFYKNLNHFENYSMQN
jgi:hypothetical protein